MKNYNVESLRTALAEFLEVSKDFGQGYKVALVVDQNDNVESSGLLMNNEFITDEESVLIYLDTFNLWENEDMNAWLYNEIGGKISNEEIESIVNKMSDNGLLNEEDKEDLEEYNEQIFRYYDVAGKFFNSDIMEEKQEELLKYWEQEYLIPDEISRLEDLISYKLEQEEINKERYEQMQKEAEEDSWL